MRHSVRPVGKEHGQLSGSSILPHWTGNDGLGVMVESVQVLALLVSLVAVILLRLGLVRVLAGVKLLDLQRVLEGFELVCEIDQAWHVVPHVLLKDDKCMKNKSYISIGVTHQFVNILIAHGLHHGLVELGEESIFPPLFLKLLEHHSL